MAIEVKDLSFGYKDQSVLSQVSLSISDGSFFVLLGQNGSGKSTLLRIMSGILPYQSGSIQINGQPLKQLSNKERARMIGFLPQHFRLAFSFSVEDVVMTGRAAHAGLRPGKRDRTLVRRAMERTGIYHLRKRSFTEISGGEQQLARIARVLSQEPRYILLDEPTTHLDLYNQGKVLNLLKDLAASGITVVAILHDPSAAFVFGDAFAFLKNGERFTPAVRQNPWDAEVLERVYGVALECVPYGGRALVAPAVRDD